MTLVKWSPAKTLMNLQREVDRLFEDFFSPDFAEDVDYRWMPRVDIEETNDSYLVTAELPGVKKDDVKIIFQDRTLTISGEKKEEREEKNANIHRVERQYGAFTRSFTLPLDVVADRIEARFKDGVLKIHIPKAEEAKPKEIEVKLS